MLDLKQNVFFPNNQTQPKKPNKITKKNLLKTVKITNKLRMK